MKLPQLVRPAFWTLILLVITAVNGAAETARLVLDINPSDGPYDGGSLNPRELAPIGERIVFSGYEEHYDELWTSDGTVNGTELLLSSGAGLLGTTRKLTFWAGEELWRSDGTPAGTFPLGPIAGSNNPLEQRAILGDLLFFLRNTGSSQTVWQTDGTFAGTRDLKISAQWLVAAGNRVFAVSGNEVWRIDPGKAPVFLKRISTIQRVMTAGDRLLMVVYDFTEEELWASDGTAAGTGPVTSFANPLPFFEASTTFLSRGKNLYFVARTAEHGDEIWVSDGTRAGTRRITNFSYDHPVRERDLSATLQEAGTRVVFAADNNPEGYDRPQIWATDGRPESTTKLMDHPCPADGYGCTLSGGGNISFFMVRVGNRVLFPAADDAHKLELWVTDGTPGGTQLLKDICPGSCRSVPSFIPSSPSTAEVYFSASDETGFHLWKTDGTPVGTRRLTRTAADYGDFLRPRIVIAGGRIFMKAGDEFGGSLRILEGGELRPLTFPTWRHNGSDPKNLFAGGRLYFSADDGHGQRLWQTSGTAGTTRPDPALRELRFDERLISAGSNVYLVQEDALSKLTEEGLQLISAFNVGTTSYLPTVAALGNLLYFRVAHEETSEIWRTDGTSAGTERLVLPSGVGRPGAVAASGDRLYFAAFPGGQRGHLWTSDGTTAGTRELTAFRSSEGLPFNILGSFHLTRVGNLDYFATYRGDLDTSVLWRTDGTPDGTRQVELSPEPVVLEEGEMFGHHGALYVLGRHTNDSSRALILWKVEGDTAVRLRSFGRRPDNWRFRFAAAGGRLLFTMLDDEHGLEVWTTDGTAAGTRVLREIGAGSLSAQAVELTSAGGRAFFTAWDEDHGTELWQTDGTAAGTRLVHDLAPGPASSHPRELTVMGDQLYFSADDGLTGRELWALPLAGPGGCQPSTTRLCLQGGRYRVEVSWRDFEKNSGQGTAVSLTPDTGYLWFFDPANVELIVKVLDGQDLNDHVWVFYGALSNVEYVLTVTDTQTGLARRYMNPPGNLASLGDTQAFGPQGAHSATPEPLVALPSPPALVSARTVPAAATGTCQPGPRRLCLNDGRFAVEASWKDFQGNTGAGTAVSLTPDTGWFWFFDPSNVEVMLKVLDGTPLNGKFWVFYGALSNVEYTLTVTDTQTGAVKEYRNPSGRFASVADTGAF